jgi:8-amino-7-oxononanoate synthase
MPPSAAATVMACLDIIEKEEDLHKKLWDNVSFMKKSFDEIGCYTFNSQTPILSVLIGDDFKACKFTLDLNERGVYANPVVAPAVPENQAMIRTSLMATHTRKDLEYVVDVFSKLMKIYDLPKNIY